MNKEIWENVKKIIDGFVAREELLKELLKDKDKEIDKLKSQVKELEEDLDKIYG